MSCFKPSAVIAAVAVIFALGSPALPALAQTPDSLSYQGQLVDSGGQPVDGTVNLRFRLWDAPSGGAVQWDESQVGVAVDEGVFSVYLGSEVPLAGVSFAEPLYLGVSINGGAELSPRTPLVPVPYARQARHVSDAALAAGRTA